MYCVIKCIVRGNQARVKKRRFASSVLHSSNVKTQICVTGPQCVKRDLKEVGGGCGDWMELAQDRERWRAHVSTVMNFRVPKMWGIF